MRVAICSSSKKALLTPHPLTLLHRHYPAGQSVIIEHGISVTPVSHFGRLAFLLVVFCGIAPNYAGAVLRPISAHS